nr:hypothetical protein [Tanacetum cinerariifolium]
MSRDVLTVGSTMRIPLLYQGEYSQWSKMFMNYLEEQTDEKAMINSIKHDDQPLPRVTQVSIAETSLTEQPSLKDKSMWSDQEKKIQKIDRLARSLLIQGLSNDIYSLIDSNKTAKDLCDALARHMLMINDLKKCGYSKDNCELNFKFLNNLQPEWKQYATMMRQNKNLMDINIDALYNLLKQNQRDVNDAIGLKKKTVVVTSDPLALIAEKTKGAKEKRKKFYSKPTNNNLRTSSTSQSANKKQEYVKSDDKKVKKKDDEKKQDMSKVKCYNYKKEDKDEQVLLAEDHAWMESSSDSDQEINANMVFMTQIEKVHQIRRLTHRLLISYYTSESESESEYETLEYYDNTTTYEKYAKLEAERYEYMIRYSTYFDNDKQHRKQIADQEVLYDKMSVQLVELHKHVRDLKNTILEKDFKISKLEEYVCNKDLEIEKCLECLNDCENKLHKMGQTNQTVHMIMPSKDKMYNGRKGIGFKNPSYFCNSKDLRPTLYDDRVINLGYTLMFLTHSDEVLEIEKFKRERENKIEFSYDYESLNASYVNKKINFSDDYFQEIINPDFDKIDSPFQQTSSLKPYVSTVILEKIIIDLEDEVVSLLEKEKSNLETIESLKSKGFESSEKVVSETENKSENDCQVIEKACDRKENPNVIAHGMFKLSVSQSVSPISVTKTSCALNSVETKLKRKRRKRTSSKEHDKQVNKDVLCANKAFVYFSDLETLSSVRRPKLNGVMWMRKGSSNTVKADLSSDNHSNLNKNVKRYSRKNLMACNNSNTRSSFDCNNARNALCNARMNASVDVNDLFVFDDVSIRKSHVSKMPFRKKPSASLNVPSRSKLNKSLHRIMRKWLPKLQPLAEPIAKSIPRIVQICLWIIDSGCSKHMTGNRALLTNFVEKFFETVRFGNNDFAVIAGYGDVVIGSMAINKVYYVEVLGHNLFSVGQFCDKGLKVGFRKSTCFVRTKDGVDLLTGDRSSNLYTIALNKVASNSSAGLPKMKFKKDHLCSACEQEKIHRKHHKSKMAFASNKPLYLLHMDLCGPMRVKSINGKQYVLVIVDDFSRYTWRVRTDNGTDFKNKTLVKFFDEVGITQHFFAARTPQQNGVVERRNRTLVEAARTMLTFANLPLFPWAEAIATACFTQNRSIIYKHFDKTPYELMNKRKPNIKFFRVFGCRCYLLNDYKDVGKLKAKEDIGVFVGYSKEFAAFRIYNKRTRKIHESVNVNFDEISKMAFKQFSLEPDLSNLNETRKSLNLSVSQVSETSKKDLVDLFHNFYDEYFDSSKIMKSSTTNVESINVEVPLHEEEVFHESSESFQEESSSFSLNNDVQQSSEEVEVPLLNDMIPNVDAASTSHNVFNKRLGDAYFNASTSFHDPSNVHIFYQPYPHEKKWTKDHPFYKIIGDPKSSVRTRGQLTNSCLFSCLLSFIKPANVPEALRDVDWVSSMQEELDQFT